jgi:hypothetical protein
MNTASMNSASAQMVTIIAHVLASSKPISVLLKWRVWYDR